MRPNDPMFPITAENADRGLTKREYIATQIMAGLMAYPDNGDDPFDVLACNAIDATDALIAELSKPTPRTTPMKESES